MRRCWLLVVMLLVTVSAGAAVFERFLSPDRPEDRAILAYLELANAGTATSVQLADLGVLLLDKGFPKDAERYLRQAIKADKENAEAIYRLGLVLQGEGKLRAATRAYERVIKLRPGHAQARFMLGLAEEHRGNRSAAIRHFAKAYRHAPELADPKVNPLVLDSRVQAEAQLTRYRREVEAATLDVRPIDPGDIRRMMGAAAPAGGAPTETAPTETAPAAAPATPPAPTPAPTPTKPATVLKSSPSNPAPAAQPAPAPTDKPAWPPQPAKPKPTPPPTPAPPKG